MEGGGWGADGPDEAEDEASHGARVLKLTSGEREQDRPPYSRFWRGLLPYGPRMFTFIQGHT